MGGKREGRLKKLCLPPPRKIFCLCAPWLLPIQNVELQTYEAFTWKNLDAAVWVHGSLTLTDAMVMVIDACRIDLVRLASSFSVRSDVLRRSNTVLGLCLWPAHITTIHHVIVDRDKRPDVLLLVTRYAL